MITAITDIPFPKLPSELVNIGLNNFILDKHRAKYSSFGESELDISIDIQKAEELWGPERAWVRENISTEYSFIGMQSMSKGDYAAHTDRQGVIKEFRNFTLLHIIKTGGPQVETKFYVPKDKSILVDGGTNYREEDLDVIDTFCFKEGSWNFLNNQVIHSVNNIVDKRIAFCVSFFQEGIPACMLPYVDPSML